MTTMLNLFLATALLAPQDALGDVGAAPLAAAQAQVQAAIEAPAEPTSAATAIEGFFPAPSGPMTLTVGDPANPLTFDSMVKQYALLTNQHVITSTDARDILQHQPLNFDRTIVVPTDEVQTTFESILRQGDFVMVPLTRVGVRVFEILSLSSAARNNLRSKAIYLSPERFHLAAKHPAVLFTTVVTLPNTDVRQVSNSMRTLVTDANTQQMLSAGNSNSMVIVGFGDNLTWLAGTLRVIDEASAVSPRLAGRVSEVIKLKYCPASELVSIINAALGIEAGKKSPETPLIQVHPRTSALVISAPAHRIEEIRGLVTALDVE